MTGSTIFNYRMTELINELMTKVFVEQALALPGSDKKDI